MDLQEFINQHKKENRNKDIFYTGLLLSAYASLLTIKPIRKWVNSPKAQQEFKNKLNKVSKSLAIPSLISKIPSKFNIPNLVDMVTGSRKEIDYSNLLISNTLGENTESMQLLRDKSRVLNDIIDFKTNTLPDKIVTANKVSNVFSVLSNINKNKEYFRDSYVSTIQKDYLNKLKLDELINERINSMKSNSNLMNELKNKIREFKYRRNNILTALSTIRNLNNEYYIPNIAYYSKAINSINKKIQILNNDNYLNFKNEYFNDLNNNNNTLSEQFLKKYNTFELMDYYDMLIADKKLRGTIFYNLNENILDQGFKNYLRQHNKNYIYKSTKKYKDKNGILHSYIYNLKYNYNTFLNNTDTIFQQLGISKYKLIHESIDNNILPTELYNYYNDKLSSYINRKERSKIVKERYKNMLPDFNLAITYHKHILNKTIKKYINDVDKYSKYSGYRQQTINSISSKASIYKDIKSKFNSLNELMDNVHDIRKQILMNYYQIPNIDSLNRIDNIDDLRNIQNKIRHNNQLNFVFNSFVYDLMKDLNKISSSNKGFFNNVDRLTNYFNNISNVLKGNNIQDNFNEYKDINGKIDLTLTENRPLENVYTWKFNKNNYKNNLNDIRNFVGEYIKDRSPNQILTTQINNNIKSLLKRAPYHGLNYNVTKRLLNNLFGGYIKNNNLNFVEDLVESVIRNEAFKNVTVQSKVISDSLILNFNILTQKNIALKVDIPIPSFTGITRTGITAPFIVNQTKYFDSVRSIWYKWVNSAHRVLTWDYGADKVNQQKDYQKLSKSINKQIASLNAELGISSENPVQDLINGFTTKGDIGALFENLPQEEREMMHNKFNLIKRLQGKDSKYKKVFLDIEFNNHEIGGVPNPLNRKGVVNDISQLGIIQFDPYGEIESIRGYYNDVFDKGKKGAIENYLKKNFPTHEYHFNNQIELTREFLKNIHLEDIDNLIFISKANTMQGGDLDRLIGMLRQYNNSVSITNLEKEKINKLLPRLNQEMNYINFQPFMSNGNFSLWGSTNIGSKKGEVLEQEIYEIYKTAYKELYSLPKYRNRQKNYKYYARVNYIRKIISERSPSLWEDISKAVKSNKLWLSDYKHQSVDDAIIMSIYFDIMANDMRKYKTIDDWKQSKEIPLKYLNFLFSQNLTNSQNVVRGIIHPFDLRTLIGQNEAFTRNKARHIFNSEKFTISLDDKKFIPATNDVVNLRKANILSEELSSLIYVKGNNIVQFKDNLYKANIFHAIRPVGGLWEGAIAFNDNTIGRAYIQNKRTKSVVVKVKKGLRVNSIIQPDDLLDISDLNSSYIGKKKNEHLYYNLSDKPKRVVSISAVDKEGYCLVELEDVVKMGTGQKVTINGVSGLLDEAMNSSYDLMLYSKAWSASNRKTILDEMLGRAIKLAEDQRLKDKFTNDLNLKAALSKIDYISSIKFFNNNERIEIITKSLNEDLKTDIAKLDKAIEQVSKFLKENFPVAQYLDSRHQIDVNISSSISNKAPLSEKMSFTKWGQIVAEDVFQLTTQFDIENEKIMQKLLLNTTDKKYHKAIKNLFGVNNFIKKSNGKYQFKKQAYLDRKKLLENIFSDPNTAYLFDVMGLYSHGRPHYVTGMSGFNAAGFIYDEMQGSHSAKTIRVSPLYTLVAAMNTDSNATLDVYKRHIEGAPDPRLNFNIRNNINTNKSIQKHIDDMVNLNELFKTNKEFTNFIETTLNESVFKDNIISDPLNPNTTLYGPQDSKVVKNLTENQVETLRILYNNTLRTKGAYYTKNGKKYWLSPDELLVRNTEKEGQYLITQQFYNLIKLHNDAQYDIKNALDDEFQKISSLKAHKLATAEVPGQSIGLTAGDEIYIDDYMFHKEKIKALNPFSVKRFKNRKNYENFLNEETVNVMGKFFNKGRSLFTHEIIQTQKSIKNIPGFDNYIKATTVKDIKQDILYLVNYDRYIENIGKPKDIFNANIGFLQEYKNKVDTQRLNNLRWELIYKAETTGQGVYADATKKFAERHKQKFSNFLLEVLNTSNNDFSKLESFQAKLSSAIELGMLSMRTVGVKFPAGSSDIYENSRIFLNIDKNTDRPMLFTSNLAVDLSKKDFDGDIVNTIVALSADPKMKDSFGYFEQDYLRAKERFEVLKRNGLLKHNELNIEMVEGSRVFQINKQKKDLDKKLEDDVREYLKSRQSRTNSRIAENNALVKYTKKYAADAFERGFIGQLTFAELKYGLNNEKRLESKSLQTLFDYMIAPIIESPLAMNKYPTEVAEGLKLLSKSQTVGGRKQLRTYIESTNPEVRANYAVFNKFLNNKFKIITYDGKLTGEVYNKGAVEFMQTLVGASFDKEGYAFLKEGDKFYNELSNEVTKEINVINSITGKSDKIAGKYLTSLDLTRGIIPIIAKQQGITQKVKQKYDILLGSANVSKAADFYDKYGYNPFGLDNALIIHNVKNETRNNSIFSHMSSSSQKFISKNKKAGFALLGAALIGAYIAGNDLGETPGEYIENRLFESVHEDETQYNNFMNQAIYSPMFNPRLHLATPMYQQKFDYAGYSSQLIQSQNLNPLQTQSVRTMPLIFN